MRKFLQKSSIFLLLLSSLTFFVITIFEKKLGAITNSYTLKRKQLSTQSDSIEVLVLGSSQSLYGVNPTYFSLRGYNAANTSQSLFYDEKITLNYIDSMPKLRYVFIAINYISMGYEIFDGQEKWRDYFYAQDWGIRYPAIKSSDLYLHSKILMYTPEMSIAYALKLFHINLTKGYYSNGWASIPILAGLDDNSASTLIKIQNSNYHINRCAEIKASLDNFVLQLRKRNITPIFFTPPVHATYYKFTDKEKLNIMYNSISELCAKFNCKYFNYFTDKRFNNDDFGDCDHLAPKGAEKFSKILNEDILKKDTISK